METLENKMTNFIFRAIFFTCCYVAGIRRKIYGYIALNYDRHLHIHNKYMERLHTSLNILQRLIPSYNIFDSDPKIKDITNICLHFTTLNTYAI